LASEYGIQSLPTTIIGNKTVVGDSDEKIFRAIISDEFFRLFSEKIH
jgi:protein-disulfide isomerase